MHLLDNISLIIHTQLFLWAVIASAANSLSRNEPPAGAILVSNSKLSDSKLSDSKKDGSPQGFSSIQAAIDSLSTTAEEEQFVFIYPGEYHEQVYIPKRKAHLTIFGATSDSGTYSKNTVTISQGKSQDDTKHNDATATLRARASNLKVYNINLKNTRGAGSQALALSAAGDKQGFYGVQLIGYQDTLLANKGAQFYANSYIEGAVDFIFGSGKAWFENCDLAVSGKGWVTASGRDSADSDSYFLFNECTVDAVKGANVSDGASYLGRPWREYARVVFQNSVLSSVINAAGWDIWNKASPNTAGVYYGEYKNTGDGAACGHRASFAKNLSEPVGIKSVLGSKYADWVDTSYISTDK